MIPGIVAGGRRAASGGGGTGDPYWANVVSLLHFDVPNNATGFPDEKGVAWASNGWFYGSDAAALAGSSGFTGGTGSLLSETDPAFAFGTGDFTIELGVNPVAVSSAHIILDCREDADTDAKPVIYCVGHDLYYYVNGVNVITGVGAFAPGAFRRIAVSRVSGVTRMFVNGAQVGSAWTDATNYDNRRFRLSGNRIDSANHINGYYDEWRATKGVGRYTSSYTPDPAPFPHG